MKRKTATSNHIVKIVALVIFICALLYTIISGTYLRHVIDFQSIFIILLINFSVLVLSDLFRDYLRAFKIVTGNLEYTTKEIQASKEAVSLSIKLIYLAGIFGTITALLILLRRLDDPSSIGPSVSVALIISIYALVINIIQNAVKSKLAKELIYRG